jgi:hypothetical protein
MAYSAAGTSAGRIMYASRSFSVFTFISSSA